MSFNHITSEIRFCGKITLNDCDSGCPNKLHNTSLFLSHRAIAQNRNALKKMGITHVLNAAHSKQGSIGDQSYYGNSIVYYGIPAEDSSSFDLSVHFKPASDFIHKALRKKNGKCSFFKKQTNKPI